MESWLSNFPNRIELNLWSFIIAGSVSLAITVLTVTWQSFKIAKRNPADTLRHE